MKRLLMVWPYIKNGLWLPLKDFLDEQLWIRRIIIGLVIIIFSLNIIQVIGITLAPKPEVQNQNRLTQYAKEAQSQLQRINIASRKILDTLSTNTYLPFYTQYMSRKALDVFLQHYTWQWIHSVNDSVSIGDVGIAVYDRGNILRGWYTTSINAPSFDTVFMLEARFARRSSVTYIDSDAMNLWFVQARKMVDIDGKYIGCSLLKYRLATSQSINGATFWRWNNRSTLRSLPARYPFQQFSSSIDINTPAMLLYIDSNDRSNPIGYFNRIPVGLKPALATLGTTINYIEGIAELLLLLILLLIFPVILLRYSTRVKGIPIGIPILFIIFVVGATILIILNGAVQTILIGLVQCAKIGSFGQDTIWIALWLPLFIFGFCIYFLYQLYKTNIAFSTTHRQKTIPRILLASILTPLVILIIEMLPNFLYGASDSSIAAFTMGLIISIGYAIGCISFRMIYDLLTETGLSRVSTILFSILILCTQFTIVILCSDIQHYWLEWQMGIGIGLAFVFYFFIKINSSKNNGTALVHPIIKFALTYLGSCIMAIILLSEHELTSEIYTGNKLLSHSFSNDSVGRASSKELLNDYIQFIEKHSDSSKAGLTIQSYSFWKDHAIADSGYYDFACQIMDVATGSLLLDLRSNSGRYQPIDSVTAVNLNMLSNSQYDVIVSNTASLQSNSIANRRNVFVTLGLSTKRSILEASSLRTEGAQWNKHSKHSSAVQYGLFDLKTGVPLLGNLPDSLIKDVVLFAEKKKNTVSGEVQLHRQRYYYRISPLRNAGKYYVCLIPMLMVSQLRSALAIPLTISLYFLVAFAITTIILRMAIRPRQVISLQDKLIFTSLIILTGCFVFTHSFMVENASTEIETIQADRFERQRTIASMESYVIYRNDSLVTLEKRLRLMAATLNCDLAIYNENNILVSSSCPSLFNLSILPTTLPMSSIASERISSEVLSPIDRSVLYSITSLVNTTPLGKSYKLLLLQQVEAVNIPHSIEEASVSFYVVLLLLLSLVSYFSQRFASRIRNLQLAMDAISQNATLPILPGKSYDEMGSLIQSVEVMNFELSKGRDRVVQAEREGAWKEMARQVAHEIKNPLTPMKLSIQHMQHAFEHQDTNFQSIFRRVQRTLSEQIDVLTRIATEFARFGEMPRRRYGFVSLPTVLDSALALFDAERSRIRFAIDVPKNLPTIYADEEEFRRTLVNLIKNAIQAIDKWGVIVVKATEDSGLIHLQITDSGNGMKEETLQKAFDPNFSTKTSGMGLGLAIVKRTITDMSGTIRVESKAGVGTTFYIELPAREPVPSS